MLGASSGLTDFLIRHPGETAVLEAPIAEPLGPEALLTALLEAVGAQDGAAALDRRGGAAGRSASPTGGSSRASLRGT